MADGGSMQLTVVTRVSAKAAAPDATQAYLTRWGVWLRQGGGLGQGYAHATAEGRLRRDGTLIRGSGPQAGLDDDQLAERVDRIVARLGRDDRRWPLMMNLYFGGAEATHATVAGVLSAQFGERITGERVRCWLREATATVRGELRAGGVA